MCADLKKRHCVPISEMHSRKRFCLSFHSVQTHAHTKFHYIGLFLFWNVKSVKKFSHRNQCRSWCWILDILCCWWFSWKCKIQLINIDNSIVIELNVCASRRNQFHHKVRSKHLNQVVIRICFECCELYIHTTWVERDDAILD